MKPRIIVVQTSYSGFMACQEYLEKLGLKKDKDFLLLDDEPDMEDFIPDTRQLLITGSFHGSQKGVAAMVQAARDRNKDLVTVSFSLDVLEGPFDYEVRKRVGYPDQFRKIIQDFQNGTLVRTEVSWKPSEPFGVFSL